MLVFARGPGGGGRAASAAVLGHPQEGRQSPSWILYSPAIAAAVYAFLYWLIDVKKISPLDGAGRPAGSNTLLMYFLPHIFYLLLALLRDRVPRHPFSRGWPGVARSGGAGPFLLRRRPAS